MQPKSLDLIEIKMAIIAKIFATILSLLLALSYSFCLPKFNDGPIVTTTQGRIQGMVQCSPKGKHYNAFLGIPFGSAPIRFAAPKMANAWTEIKDCTKFGPPCIQPSFSIPPTIGVEDCLTLNVFTPNLTGPLLPVLIFIHGGSYFDGYADIYGIDPLIEHSDIVIVMINYRLSSLGFLSTADATAPGNFGLLDQNLGMQWIQSNIAAFNGDPTAVTLSGESAGSTSVVSHLVSPKSAGLFHRLIAESGTVLNGWAFEEHPLYYAQRLGEKMSCPVLDDSEQLIFCLRQKNAEDIVIKSFDIMLENLTLSYVPVIEPVIGGEFLTENPLTLLEEGRFNQVPIIMGFNKDEGGLIYPYVEQLMLNINEEFFDDTMPKLIRMLTDYRTNLINISYAIRDEYYSNIDLDNSSQVVRANLDVLGDMAIISGSVQSVQIVSKYVSTWMCEFNYVGNWSWQNYTGEPDCTHGIELIYLYNMSGVATLNEKDNRFSMSLVQFWTDFVKHGNPTPVGSPVLWSPTISGESNYLSLDQPNEMFNEFQTSRMNFWLNTVPNIASS